MSLTTKYQESGKNGFFHQFRKTSENMIFKKRQNKTIMISSTSPWKVYIWNTYSYAVELCVQDLLPKFLADHPLYTRGAHHRHTNKIKPNKYNSSYKKNNVIQNMTNIIKFLATLPNIINDFERWVVRIVRWSDVHIFCNFWKWTHCCGLAVFLWAQFQNISKFCRTPLQLTCDKVLIFNKSQKP